MLGRRSMTLLVLLPAAAWARVVPADLGLVAPHLLDCGIVAADARRLRRPAAGARRRKHLWRGLWRPKGAGRRSGWIVQDERRALWLGGGRIGGISGPASLKTGRSPHK